MINSLNIAYSILPLCYRDKLKFSNFEQVEEIRLRVGQPISFIINGKETSLSEDILSDQELIMVIEKITEASYHSVASSISKGFVNYKGLRIGICGTGVINWNELTGFRNFSSVAIRIPHEHYGICDEFIDELCKFGFENTLIVSPPGFGKTSLLRELIRVLSDSGLRIAVIDERNELSGSDCGLAQFNLGRCTDIMLGVPKYLGFQLLLRGMNPEIIAMDEISSDEDAAMIEQIIGCGVNILATAHGKNIQTMEERALYKKLFDKKAFKNYITISRVGDRHSYQLERSR